ncbi:amidohydrolase family protein [Flavobacterium sp. IMCC34852]|uniref:Amidohydrolase family protein n=1 Tax=Flavobacterium rivulicola TaxID=2732161 RepID=A0A7Y3RBH4_9FLAO|nr:amidohydrolase family protein [Flavobacterium sp. IMCC34852]NNT72877.1 amidohydrolase family protein [Flavobacterium sp. IMCC34852]
MKKKLNLVLLISSQLLIAQTYITNVTIADVERQKLIPNQTVVITKDLISNIQPSKKIKIPANANIIDAKGKYLFPGLVDAHIHFFQNGGLYTRPDAIDFRNEKPYNKEVDLAHQTMEDKLRRYLQNGITTVIDVGASYSFLKQRKDFSEKDFAPTIYMTGPLATTFEPTVYNDLKDEEPFNLVKSIEDGIKMVQNQLPLQPDFIKIWYITDRDKVEASARKNLPIIKAIIDEAHKHKLKVAVHATERITAQLSVESGCDFLVHSVDDELLKDDFVQLLKKKKTILCPTLIVHNGYINTFGQKLQFTNHDLLKSNPFQLGSLLDLRHLPDTLMINNYKRSINNAEYMAIVDKENAICRQNLKLLSDAGVLIATGTDAGNIGTLHASSYLSELKAMSASGLTNWQIIQASTINGAKVLNKENEFGTIAIGKKANLILLEGNPIENLEYLTKINQVVNRGIFFSPTEVIPDTPEALAQRQLNAYNLKNIEAFLEPYADDVEIYNYPNTLQSKGKENMRKEYSEMFDKVPNLHCQLVERIVQGNIVIDKERVQFGKQFIEAVAIYHIENGKIKRVYFIQ